MTLSLLSSQSITKQAIAKKMNQECIHFIRDAVFALIQRLSTFHRLRKTALFSSFHRVLLQDSTQIRLPDRLAYKFPGATNHKKQDGAALKIQAVYDLLGETFHYFHISGFTRTDQTASPDIFKVAKSGDLVLRDLGYFSTAIFQKMLDRGIHFLSRMRRDVSVIDPKTLKPINLVECLRRCPRFDRTILLGAEQKVMVRLVALPVPEQIANERRRKAKNRRDTRFKLSARNLALLGWNIFVTSVDSQTWDPETVQEVYGVRWRIEIIFKSWKSHFNLTKTPTGSAVQVEVIIWAKLFAICLFQKLVGGLEFYTAKRISLLKSAQFFNWILLLSLTRVEIPLEAIQRHLELEKRKKAYNPTPCLLS
jgi:Transposase DDE domain